MLAPRLLLTRSGFTLSNIRSGDLFAILELKLELELEDKCRTLLVDVIEEVHFAAVFLS